MFEKEAEEIAKRKISNFIPQQWGVSLIRTEPTWETVEGAPHFYLNSLAKMWQEGAEFGYNKANEWHYPSKGEYPEEDKRYLCKIKAFVGSGITYECFDYDSEYSSWKGASGEVIAWKEIVLPKEIE